MASRGPIRGLVRSSNDVSGGQSNGGTRPPASIPIVSLKKKTKNKNSLFQERSYARLRLSLSRLFPSFVFLLGFFFRFAFGVEPQLIPCVQMVPTQSLSVAAGEGSWVLCTANTNRVILIDEFTRPVD